MKKQSNPNSKKNRGHPKGNPLDSCNNPTPTAAEETATSAVEDEVILVRGVKVRRSKVAPEYRRKDFFYMTPSGPIPKLVEPGADSPSSPARLALALAENPELLFELVKQSTMKELELALRADPIETFDTGVTFQARLLTYLESTCGLKNGRNVIQDAEDRRRILLGELNREALLAFHFKYAKLEPLISDYSDFERYVLNRAILSDNPNESFQAIEVREIISKKLKEGFGENLLTYLAERLKLQRDKLKSKSPVWREEFHPALTVAALLWTSSATPLWMMPSAGAVNIINSFLKNFGEEPIKQKNFNTLVNRHKLARLDAKIVSKFISVKINDPLGLALQEEFEGVMGVPLAKVRRGASARPVS